MKSFIKTDIASRHFRTKSIKIDEKQLLISRLDETTQAQDLTQPVNCGGVGRIRHFRRATPAPWPSNSLPIDPAAHCLRRQPSDIERAQVFQNAACNWRCWYCYVPFNLLRADENSSIWLTTDELVERYANETAPATIIDLSGGQPDLIPEWVPWMMQSLRNKGLADSTYLWSDDNLSTDYFWDKLSRADIDIIRHYPNYGKVGCFKGFDSESFSFNTRASPDLFTNQFRLFKRIMDLGIDAYGYATLTSEIDIGIEKKIATFVNLLQEVHRLLPLRVIPLKVSIFTPAKTENRIKDSHNRSLEIQEIAIQCWNKEIQLRFSKEEIALPIHAIKIKN